MTIRRTVFARWRGFFALSACCLSSIPSFLAVPINTTQSGNRLMRPEENWRKPVAETEFARFAGWVARFQKTPAANKHSLEPEGLQLAGERRQAMATLIRKNPEHALELAVPVSVRKLLPKQIAAEVEETISGQGSLELLAALPEPGNEAFVKGNFWIATINGRTFDAYVYGRRLEQPTRRNIPLNGVALGSDIAIASNPARVLDAEETEAIKETIATEPVCGTSGLPSTTYGDETALDVGGQVYFFCQSSHAEAFNETLIDQEQNLPLGDTGGGEVAASAWTEGQKQLILIRVDFPDLMGDPFPDTTGTNLATGLNNFYAEMSYGRAGFSLLGQGSEMTPTFRMSQPAAYYGTNNFYTQLRTEARNAATAAGYVLSNYQFDLICMGSVPGFGWAGLGYIGARGAWIRNSFGTGVSAHELGHNLGLNHANFWDTSGQSVIGSPGTSVEYGDSFDTMGSASAGNNHFNARYKNYLNWLTTNEVLTITNSGTYRVYAHDKTNLTSGVRGLRIVKNTSTNYWVEFRQKFTSNKWLMSGAGLRWAQNGSQKSHLLDTTPGSSNNKNDSAIVIGRTFSDPDSGIHITPIGKGGTTPESLDVVVNLGTFPANVAPTATIVASATNAATGVTLTFNASASDTNGDPLSYYWDFGDGSISTNNSSAISKSWTNTGEYVVRCSVSDMKGGVASDSAIVRIGSPSTYQISGLVTDNSLPVEGVRVYVSSTRMAYTDSDGTYNIVGLPAGSYTVSTSLYGYNFTNTFSNPVSVGPNATDKNFITDTVNTNAPTFLAQPQSLSVAVGSNATFSVVVTGASPLSYQWRFNGTNISDATSNSYTRLNVQPTDAGNYSVVVTNLYGSATSANATLTMELTVVLSIARQGSAVTLAWNAVAGYTYRVQYKNDPSDMTWLDLPPDVTAAGPTASATNTLAAPHRIYRLLVVE